MDLQLQQSLHLLNLHLPVRMLDMVEVFQHTHHQMEHLQHHFQLHLLRCSSTQLNKQVNKFHHQNQQRMELESCQLNHHFYRYYRIQHQRQHPMIGILHLNHLLQLSLLYLHNQGHLMNQHHKHHNHLHSYHQNIHLHNPGHCSHRVRYYLQNKHHNHLQMHHRNNHHYNPGHCSLHGRYYHQNTGHNHLDRHLHLDQHYNLEQPQYLSHGKPHHYATLEQHARHHIRFH